jgi:hypothetical protein
MGSNKAMEKEKERSSGNKKKCNNQEKHYPARLSYSIV